MPLHEDDIVRISDLPHLRPQFRNKVGRISRWHHDNVYTVEFSGGFTGAFFDTELILEKPINPCDTALEAMYYAERTIAHVNGIEESRVDKDNGGKIMFKTGGRWYILKLQEYHDPENEP